MGEGGYGGGKKLAKKKKKKCYVIFEWSLNGND